MMWKEIVEHAGVTRKELHKIPEPCWHEEKTSEFLKTRLDELGIPWRKCSKTGVVAQLAHDKKGVHIGLRTDMDGLGIAEENGFDYKSLSEGCMHGCGHDGHMAVLLATAQWLKQHEKSLPGPVRLIFQPAEEGGYGAKQMIEGGALDGVDRIFGWHNWPAIPFGRAVCDAGTVMAANASFEIVVTGSGGHASQPEICRDPVLAAAAITLGLQQIVARKVRPQQAAVLSVTSFDAKSGETVIPDRAILKGTVRGGSTAGVVEIGERIEECAVHIGHGYDTEVQVVFKPRYPAVVNSSEEAGMMAGCFSRVFGNSYRDTDIGVPLMASEDFSYYLGHVPGAFALVGAGDGGRYSIPCHNTKYDFNDSLIEPMVRVLSMIVGAPLP